MYTGNEGDITWFYNNTVISKTLRNHSLTYCACSQGFAWDLASTFQGLLIFVEHRYYGESLPFGSASYQDAQHLNFLSSEQALADFVDVIADVKVAMIILVL